MLMFLVAVFPPFRHGHTDLIRLLVLMLSYAITTVASVALLSIWMTFIMNLVTQRYMVKAVL